MISQPQTRAAVASADQPPYLRILAELRQRIDSGRWAAGLQIPPERELVEEFGVCAATIKRSLSELQREGLVWGRQGKGRFVADALAARSRTGVLGVIIHDLAELSHPVLAQRMAGIHEVLNHGRYHLKVVAINPGLLDDAGEGGPSGWVDLVEPWNLDGMIVVAQQPHREQIETLARHAPLVWMDHAPIRPGRLEGVQLDYAGGAYDAARHLVELGHQRIGLLTADDDSFSIAHQQRDGVRLGMRGSDAKLISYCTDDLSNSEEGRRLGRAMLADRRRPTALICGSDELAQGVLDVLHDQRVRVPEDISLIGWNDTLTAERTGVALTSVYMDFKSIGRASAHRLLRSMNPAKAEQPEANDDPLPAEFIVRDSTTAAVSGVAGSGAGTRRLA